MDQILNPQFFESQHSASQIGSQDLRIVVFDKFFIVRFFSVESETFSWSGTSSSTCSLLGASFADGGHQQRFYSHTRVENFLLGKSRIDDVDYTIDGDRSFSDVGCHYYFSTFDASFVGLGWILENSLLLMRWQGAIERNDANRSHLIAHSFDLLFNFATGQFNFFLACQKKQNISFTLVLMNCDSSFDRGLDIICLWLFAEVDVDVVHSAGNV